MAVTYAEMQDTFNALKKTATYLEEKWADIEAFLKGKSRFVFVGCGSSYSNAKSYAMMCNMSAGKPAIALAAGDILLHAERYKKAIDGALVVFVSRSGRTSELLMALSALKAQDIEFTVASIISADDTPLEEMSDFVLSTPWAFDESVCQTRCVTNAYFVAAYIVAKVTGDEATLADLGYLITEGPGYAAKAESLAKELAEQPWTHAVVLADAEIEGLAEEGALVFKEVCQLPSSYHHLLDVRHGPMVLIGNQTLVIAAPGKSSELERDLLRDAKAKGAFVVAFTDTATELEQGVMYSFFGQSLTHIAKGIPLIVLCQMIAYFKSLKTGADPDKPTGLDPWISL